MTDLHYIVAEHGEHGSVFIVGPFNDQSDAEIESRRIQTGLRVAEFNAYPNDYYHPDDARWFAWVVPMIAPGEPIKNPHGKGNIKPMDDYPEEYQ